MMYNSIKHGGSLSMPAISQCDLDSGETWLPTVLQKANEALYYDIKGDIQGAIHTYEETVRLLQRVLARGEDKAPLREFHDLYVKRVQVLSSQLHLPNTPDADDMLHSIAEELRLPNDRPPSLTNDSKTSQDASRPTTPVSIWASPDEKLPPPVPGKCAPPPPPASSIFAAMFAKRASKSISEDHSVAPPPKPSQSTPIISNNRPSMWTQSVIRKNRHSSDFTPPCIHPVEILPLMLPLPILPSPSDDYFGFGSTITKGLLFETPKSTLNQFNQVNVKPIIHQKLNEPQRNTLPDKAVSAVEQRDDLHSPTKRASAIENLKMVLAETDNPRVSSNEKGADSRQSRQHELAGDKVHEVVPPPRTHSMTLDRIGLSKIGLAARHKQQQQVEDARPLRNQSSSISLSGFWKQHKSQPSLQISTSSLRMRGHSFSGGRSPQSPPAQSGRQGSAPSSELTFRRGSLFSVSSASAIHGASPLKEKIHPDDAFAVAPALSDTPNDAVLMKRIQKSMEEGGYITDRLYAPKRLWYQLGIRLPALDTRLAVCRLLMDDLAQMKGRDRFEDVRGARSDVAALEHSLERIKATFSKKLGLSHEREEGEPSSGVSKESHPSNSSKTSMTIAAWGSKLSKSMERIKLDTLRPSDEQFNLYILALQRLFSLSQVLESWQEQYSSMARQILTEDKDKAEAYYQIVKKTRSTSDVFHRLVCGFVMDDFARLLSKWMKRNREWTEE